MNENKKKMFSSSSFKHGSLATVLTVAAVVCTILINIIAIALADKFPLKIDLTAKQEHTISSENKKYIKAINKDVTVIVTVDAQYYKNSFANSLAQGEVFSGVKIEDATGGKYFSQAEEFLKEYSKINPHIKVKYIDMYSTDFAAITTQYKSTQLYYGDYIIECTVNVNGKETTRHKILSLNDLFSVEDPTGQAQYGGAYSITGSNVESAVTNALNFVTADKTDYATFITGYNTAAVDSLKSLLTQNNYVTSDVKSLLTADIPATTNLVVLAAPKLDFSKEEIAKLDNFLLDSKTGTNLIYFANSTALALPNLEVFLKKWGISFKTGTVYETDASLHPTGLNTTVIMQDSKSDYTKEFSSAIFASSTNKPMFIDFTDKDKFHTTSILKSSATSVLMPSSAAEKTFKAATATVKGPFEAMVLSSYTVQSTISSTETLKYSNLLAFSSENFMDASWSQYSGIGNSDLILAAINGIVGRSGDSYSINAKTIDTSSFQPTATTNLIVGIIFIPVLTLAFVAVAIVISVRRKRK